MIGWMRLLNYFKKNISIPQIDLDEENQNNKDDDDIEEVSHSVLKPPTDN